MKKRTDERKPFIDRLRAIETDPRNAWHLAGKENVPEPGSVHKPADEVLLDALRAAGWGAVADEYVRIRDDPDGCDGFWYE